MTAALLRRDMDQLGIEERELTTAWVYKVEDDAIGSLFILLEEPNSSKLGAHLCLRNSQLTEPAEAPRGRGLLRAFFRRGWNRCNGRGWC